MSVSVQSSQSIFLGNGSTTTWTFPWVGVSASFINVYYVDSTGDQTLLTPTLYTIGLNAAAPGQLWGVGGTITYPLMGSPIANGTSLIVQRAVPYSQTTNVANQTAYPLSVQQALDTLCFEIQQAVGRTGQLRGTWASGVFYNFGDIVVDGANGASTDNLYVCANSNTSGVWATDLENGYWSLAFNIQAIVNALPSIANNSVFANITGSTAAPIGVTATALLDHAFGSTQGNMLYRNATTWTVLAPGVAGQNLRSGGAAANLSWANAGAGTITEVTTSSGITGGGSSGSVNVALSTVANNSILANVSGGILAPSATTLSALIDSAISSTQGSILYRNNGSWVALGPGTSGQTLQTNGAGANPSWVANNFAPQSFIAGCIPSSMTGSSTTASMTVSSGQATNTTNATIITCAGYSWAASNGNAINGTDAAASTLANSTTYHMYLISGGSGTGTFASATYPAGSVSFPAGYTTYARRIFSFSTSVAGAPVPYVAIEAEGGATINWLATQVIDINAFQGTSRTLYVLTVPTGIKMEPIVRCKAGTTSSYIILTSGDETDVAPTATGDIVFNSAPGHDTGFNSANIETGSSVTPLLTTNTSGQIGARANGASVGIWVVTRGFKDFRRS